MKQTHAEPKLALQGGSVSKGCVSCCHSLKINNQIENKVEQTSQVLLDENFNNM